MSKNKIDLKSLDKSDSYANKFINLFIQFTDLYYYLCLDKNKDFIKYFQSLYSREILAELVTND